MMSQLPEQATINRRLIVLTGASGSGKTTIAKRCATLHSDWISIWHFEAIPIPSVDEMVLQYGSTDQWQYQKTLDWFEKLATLDESRILFEGQSRIAFIKDALVRVGISNAKTILVDCDHCTRMRRLTIECGQPELANETMLSWAEYLRHEAHEFACDVLDTSTFSVDDAVEKIALYYQ